MRVPASCVSLASLLGIALTAPPVAGWELQVESVGYNGVRLSVEVIVSPGGGDPAAWVGLTACDSDQTFDDEAFLAVFDFKPQRVRPGRERKLSFHADVGPDADGYLVAAWRRKVPKCERDERRPGCKEYGYVLDGELASLPNNAYWMYPGCEEFESRQAHWEVRLMPAGASAEDMARVRALAEKYARGKRRSGEAKLAYEVTDGPKTKNPRDKVQVLFRYKAEEDDADALARALLDLGEVEVKHWPRAPAPLIVAVPKL